MSLVPWPKKGLWSEGLSVSLPLLLTPAGKVHPMRPSTELKLRLQIITGLVYVAYLAVAMVGLVRMPVNMTMDKLVLDHSPYKPLFSMLESFSWTDFF